MLYANEETIQAIMDETLLRIPEHAVQTITFDGNTYIGPDVTLVKPLYSFNDIIDTPTTLQGYNIQDAATLEQGNKADSAIQGALQDGSEITINDERQLVLPNFPTELPASDVYAWAKASTKPSYNYSEIIGAPTVPTSANYLERGAWWSSESSLNVDNLRDGIHFVYDSHGAPVTGTLVTFSGEPGSSPYYCWQMILNYQTGSDLYIRNYNGDSPGAWGVWRRIARADEIPTKLSDLTNDSGYITIGSVGNGVLTITQNGTSKGTFSANQSGNVSINLTDTTYESKSAASGGTAVSLVTTGEKYTWNAKSNFSGVYADLTGLPTLGTAAAKDIPASGNASTTQVVLGSDTRLTNSRPASDVYAWAKASTKPYYNFDEILNKPLGQPTIVDEEGSIVSIGVATLDTEGKVPTSQLPSYVDDVLEYPTKSDFPKTGESGIIYLAKDENKTYRWTGTTYGVIGSDLALGETSATAYAGDKGKIVADNLSALTTNFNNHTTNTTLHITADERTTWNGKQNALTIQTAYSAKGSAVKVPQITTNTLGQVTKIEEVTITQPDISGKADKASISAGTYTSVTVNTQGIVTGGSNPIPTAVDGSVTATTLTIPTSAPATVQAGSMWISA